MSKVEKFNPLVSIVIPVYNGEKYVKEAIDSALAQTYKNIEIIVVNDGSTDKTEEICKSYGNKIRYFSKKNGGVSSALNLAIEKMNGEYFSWLSHDDLYFPNKISKQIDFINNYNQNDIILFSIYILINENGELIGVHKSDNQTLKIKPEYSLLRGNVNGITMLIPKDAFLECGKFNEKLRCTQDYDLWLKMIKKYRFIHTDNYLSLTRIHQNQDTQSNPLVVKEGNNLWINLIESVSDSRKIELEGSIYNYYKKTSDFLKDTPYDKAFNYVCSKLKKMETDVNYAIKKGNITVSVIIPFYNRKKELKRAIKSVIAQTYKNIELILIDDCSTEKNEFVENLVLENKNIKYYRNEKNMGASFSRNVGIEKSNGTFIAFLDSDDEFVIDKIETQLKLMILNNSNVSYSDYYVKNKNKKILFNAYTKNENDNNEYLYNCKLATPTIMVNRKFLLDNNIKYKTDLDVCEDICFYLDILKYENITYVNVPLSIINTNNQSCINNYEKRKKGLCNIINYVYNDSFYLGRSEKELELLFEGVINFEYLINLKKEKCNVFRYFFRKIVPLSIRKRIKQSIKIHNKN